MLTYVYRNVWHVPKERLHAFVVGAGPDGFIGQVAHVPNLEASRLFKVQWAVPSRDGGKCELFRANMGMDSQHVSNSYEVLLERLKRTRGRGRMPVTCIYTETPKHAEMISAAADAGVTEIVVDKPTTTNLKDQVAVEEKLREQDARCYVTFNHVWNAPVFQLRELCREAGPEGIGEVFTFFKQDWCCTRLQNCRQQDWRLAHTHGAGLDIGTHAAHLASFVLDSPIVAVSNAHCSRKGEHGEDCYDTGYDTLHFANARTAQLCYSNADPGHLDNIGITVEFRQGKLAGKKVMWRNEINGGNSLLVGSAAANPDKPYGTVDWTEELRRGREFSDEVNALFSFQPPGHGYDWGDYWKCLYLAIGGDILLRRGAVPDDAILPIMRQAVPLFEQEGHMTIAWMHAHDQSFVSGGQLVELQNVGTVYQATPPKAAA